MINSFRNEYFFLSNFYPCEITDPLTGLTFQNAEAMFQSYKCISLEERERFCNLSAKDAKALGRRVKLRTDLDWNENRDLFMFSTLVAKFTQHPQLMKKLEKTHPHDLVEGNTWNDTYWGVCNGKGENRLGELLMDIRILYATDYYKK